MDPVSVVDIPQQLTSIRSLVEVLAENLSRPDPDLELAQALANVALSGLRKLEQTSSPFLEHGGS